MTAEWLDIGTLDDIPRQGARTVTTPRGDIAVFRTLGDEIFALLREQQEKSGCTLVVVTHDRRFIRPDDHVLEIEDGRIVS